MHLKQGAPNNSRQMYCLYYSPILLLNVTTSIQNRDTDATGASGKSWHFEEKSSEIFQAGETQAKAAEGWEDEQLSGAIEPNTNTDAGAPQDADQ